jgi:hypothetical protein
MIENIGPYLISAGPVGVFCLYLIWRQERDTKACAAERKERLDADRERVEVDREHSRVLGGLAELIKERIR